MWVWVSVVCWMLGVVCAQYVTTDDCSWHVWDEPEHAGVRSLSSRGCSSGSLTWHLPSSPLSAVRLTLGLARRRPYLLCLSTSAHFLHTASVAVEGDGGFDELLRVEGAPPGRLPSLDDELRVDGGADEGGEACVLSADGRPLVLFVQVQGNEHTPTLGVFEVMFDLEAGPRATRLLQPELMEECRPCTEEELLAAFCSSDFVVHGRMVEVEHRPDRDESHLHVTAAHVVRQTHAVFRRDVISKALTGTVVAPRRCGVRRGDGDFVFMGRVRLKRAILRCAPRKEEFEEVWRKAMLEGSITCTMN